MLISSEAEMMSLGEKLASELATPCVIELVGDVGAGKTTFTRGLAKGLGVKAELSSPSFTISREYAGEKADLIHYDFYRIADPGLMAEDLADAISRENTVVVVEWGESIQDILPANHKVIEIKYIDENTREVNVK
jgi:tRNA threonylcarbamoyladenosine biosynthesis protein TsaE